MLRKIVCLAATAAGLFAQPDPRRVFVPSTDSSTMTALTVDPLGLANTFSASQSSFLVLSNLDGSKFYVAGRSGSDTLVVVNSSFTSVLKRIDMQQNGTAAAITPDGRRVLVTAGTLHVIDTSSDSEIIGGGLNVGTNPIDVAVSLDGSRAFVLTSPPQPDVCRLTAVGLSGGSVFTVGAPLQLSAGCTGVTAGPNGLLYVSAQNALYEIDPRTMTTRTTIPLNAKPGKVAFIPDGSKAVAVNQTPVTGSSVLFFDMNNRTVLGTIPAIQTPGGGSVVLDKLVVVSNTRAFATTTEAVSNRPLYEITINTMQISGPNFAGVEPPTGVRGMVASNELPQAKYLFLATSNQVGATTQNLVYRFDLGSNLPTGQFSVNTLPGPLSLAGPAQTGTAVDAQQFNTNQTVKPGEDSLPIVVRVTGTDGRPLYAVSVEFSTTAPGVSIQSATQNTNGEGYALTTVSVSASTTSATFSVVARIGGGALTRTFNFTVGVVTPGPGGTAGGLQIVSGNGQVVQEQFSTSFSQNPLIAGVFDGSGNPVAGVSISFQITQGAGVIFAGPQGTISGSGGGNQLVMTTDSNGLASIHFTGTFISLGSSYAQTTIQASTASQIVNFVITTSLLTLPGGGQAPLPFADLQKPTLENLSVSGRAGDTLAGAVVVRVIASTGGQTGLGIPNVGVKLVMSDTTPGRATAKCAGQVGDVLLTDASGFATCDVVLGSRIGTNSFTVGVGGYQVLRPQGIALNITAGPPASMKIISGNNQSANPGQRLQQALVAEVSDAFGNLLEGTPVQWQVVSGAATISVINSVADINGRVGAVVTLGQTAGAVQIRVTAGAATATFTATVNVRIVALNAISGGGQTAITGQTFAQPLVVQLLDDRGSGVPGSTVSFAVTGGSATVGPASATTDAQGRATVTVTAGATAGTITIVASSAGLSTSFTLNSRLPGPVFTAASFVNTASGQRGVTPLGIATINVSGIAPNLRGSVVANLVADGALPTTLADVEVRFNNIPAPIYAISNINNQESVTVQVPGELSAPGTASVTIRSPGGGTSTVDGIQVQALQPGIFETVDSQGRRYAILLRPDGSFVTPENPGRRGEQLRMIANGLGQVSPATATNRAGTGGQAVVAPVVVGVNDAGIRVVSAEYMAGAIGLYVVTFELPSDTPTGTNRRLALAVGDPLVFGNGSVIAAIQ